MAIARQEIAPEGVEGVYHCFTPLRAPSFSLRVGTGIPVNPMNTGRNGSSPV